ncbi:uncharacterized protein L3040_007016 [Drepanopeziza brunnea f. sp. 'multigermtubi']|uniref:uncharacterized protein n=1 Tax=Drepanopeziza brunnea f. sp. 'multigermtubi' TaxID=698441 RepID=UPI0023A5F595|nr:hypothetical protein L3040_007016 [Drepanopeziza brunnea f. sp. 'multigermtubi']
MENLTLDEQPSLGPSPSNQQLPPQMFTTAAQLLDMTDKKLMVALRDGRKLIGVLRSWDQFANLVLQSTIERIFVPPSSTPTKPGNEYQPGLYADVPRGIFFDDDPPPGYEKADVELIHRLSKERKAREARREKFQNGKLRALGFEGEAMGEANI